jgi:hypothetical protein
MIYVSVPKKVRIDNIANIKQYVEVIALFARHGLGIAHFSNRGASFYNVRDCNKNYVPIDAFYKMDKKQFVVFVEMVKRLDEAEKHTVEMLKVATNSQGFPRG